MNQSLKEQLEALRSKIVVKDMACKPKGKPVKPPKKEVL